MSGWEYRARTIDGTRRRGVIQAATWEEANRALAARKLIPERVRPARKDKSFRLRRSPQEQALVIFTRQFATMTRSGVPIVLSLEILESLTDDTVLADALAAVRRDVEAGQTLADAMRSHPKVFTPIFINMVEAGEEGAHLDMGLVRLADYMERTAALRQRMRGAMIYPSVVLLVGLTTLVVMLVYVVPTFQGLFSASGLELPLPTLLLVRASNTIVADWLYFVLGALGGTLAVLALLDSKAGRRLLDAAVLRTPVIGTLTRKAAVSRFARTMASMLSSGVNLVEAFPAAARTTNNGVIIRAIQRAQSEIQQGETVHQALARTRVLPKLVARMVQVGEESGRLDEMFDKVADFYDADVEMQADGLMKALEPALVALVGLILGAMVVTMYLPIFEVMTVNPP